MPTTVQIIHLEDDSADTQLVGNMLSEAGLVVQLQRVHTLEAFRAALGSPLLKVIISDYTLPGVDALEALHLARQLRPEIPFIFLSGTIGEELAVQALNHGATDYVSKTHMARLVPAVERALHEAEEQTLRIRGDQELARTTARFNGIISSAMDAIISIDVHQRVVLFNPAAERLFQVTAAEALGQSINRFIPLRFRAAHTQHVEEFGKTGVSNRKMGALGSLSAVRANGQEFPIEASISQVQVDGERLFTVILRDITERTRGEEALRESEERFRTMANAIPQLAWMARPDGSIFWYNQRWDQYTGTTPEQMEGWGWRSVHDPKVLPTVLQRWRTSIARSEPLEMEFPCAEPTGNSGLSSHEWCR